MQDLKKVILFGFVFGIIFSLLLSVSNFEIDSLFLWFIPFLVAVLCVIGAFVGEFVANSFKSRGVTNEPLIQMISFLCAALVNVLIVYTIVFFTGMATLQRDLAIGSLLGLSVGAIYMIYSYRLDQIKERMKFLEELSEKNKQLQEASRKLAITEERNRMGRELHDSVSQGLHGLIFSLHSLRHELKQPDDRVSEIITYIEKTANATLDELRTMIEELKPSLLAEEGLEEAIKVNAHLFEQRNEIPVEIEIELIDEISPSLELAIYRINQEALANIEKHANANHVYVKLTTDDEYMIAMISR